MPTYSGAAFYNPQYATIHYPNLELYLTKHLPKKSRKLSLFAPVTLELASANLARMLSGYTW